MNEKQKDIYNALMFYYDDQKRNVAATIADTIYMFVDIGEEFKLDNTDFIPALEAFLREVKADE
ncbi:hypothetical protein C7H83_10215 [Tetragenococcus halophilus]|uniref:Uncharacterized protein n=2 Tax=Tetragenococcus halophilus TaxID=51669 RepID=A0A3G5FKN8_TETHA|nr:hypothetical protein [Tetragenococcus halophilus]AYW50815.1 hypothetical protein C7H83_10215 [Tetragenococcus halophilus]GBD64899.1 hypothetical protein TEHD23766T_2326 [Tetragenococcus halophilus subsp. flandriensis]GMA08911.1 hypothetical protein GCM10025886_20620 [Tetragenococcus halophilus subsp. flandriensis]